MDPKQVQHVKNWKPQILILSFLNEEGKPKEMGLIVLVDQLKKGNGLSIFGACRIGDSTKANFRTVKQDKIRLYEFFRQRQSEVFSKVVLARTARKGLKALIQSAGLGGLEPNTVLLAWPESWETQPLRAQRFCKLVKYAENCGMAVITIKPVLNFECTQKLYGSIDIWWFRYDGGLICLLVYLLQKHKVWRHCMVRVFYVISNAEETLKVEMRGKLVDWFMKFRIFTHVFCEVVVVPMETLAMYREEDTEAVKRREERLSAAGKRDATAVLEELERARLQHERALANEGEQHIKAELQQVGLARQPAHKSDLGSVLNTRMLDLSSQAELVILSLPEQLPGQTAEDFLQFCESMTAGLRRVMLVRATDDSVVTEYT